MKYPKVYILLLNYNGWADTIECLESLHKLDYPNYQIVVVDNKSKNNSIQYLKNFFEGKLEPWVHPDNKLRNLSIPPTRKPIEYIEYTKDEAEKGGDQLKEQKLKNPVVLIKSNKNLGFSGGNNIGIRYALKKKDFEFIWLLNNDTVVTPDSLKKLVKKAFYYRNQGKKVGMIGNKLYFYDMPDIIQGVGGKFNKLFCTWNNYGVLEKDTGQYDSENVLKKIFYISAASMLIDRKFIEEVGLLNESFFLYGEEPDLVIRGRKKGWEIGYCWESIVYHKEGGSIGSSSIRERKSALSDYHSTRSRIKFTKIHFPYFLPFVYLSFPFVFFNRIKRKQFDRIKVIINAIFGKDFPENKGE